MNAKANSESAEEMIPVAHHRHMVRELTRHVLLLRKRFSDAELPAILSAPLSPDEENEVELQIASLEARTGPPPR